MKCQRDQFDSSSGNYTAITTIVWGKKKLWFAVHLRESIHEKEELNRKERKTKQGKPLEAGRCSMNDFQGCHDFVSNYKCIWFWCLKMITEIKRRSSDPQATLIINDSCQGIKPMLLIFINRDAIVNSLWCGNVGQMLLYHDNSL